MTSLIVRKLEVIKQEIIKIDKDKQDKIIYSELFKLILKSKDSEVEIKFYLKNKEDEDFDEDKHLINGTLELVENNNLKLKGDNWEIKILPSGQMIGVMPKELSHFLTYDKVIKTMKSHNGLIRQIISIDYIRRDEEIGRIIILTRKNITDDIASL